MTADPIGFGGRDFNLYRYAKNSPLTYTDPLGLLALFNVSDSPNIERGRAGSSDTDQINHTETNVRPGERFGGLYWGVWIVPEFHEMRGMDRAGGGTLLVKVDTSEKEWTCDEEEPTWTNTKTEWYVTYWIRSPRAGANIVPFQTNLRSGPDLRSGETFN